MSGFVAAPGELMAARQQLAAAHARAVEAMQRACSRAEGLFATGWSGPAATACSGAWAQWHTGATRSLDALERIAAGVERCARTYADAESATTALLRTMS